MITALTIAHIFVSVVLVFMVLIQDSKGDASGLLGSSGGQSVFGATGATSFIVKATRTVAALFAVGCIVLAYMTSNQANSSGVLDRITTPTQKTAPIENLDNSIPAGNPAANAGTETETAIKTTPEADSKTETPQKK